MPATNTNLVFTRVFTRHMLSAIYAIKFSDSGEKYVILILFVYNFMIVSTDICLI
jgi:hypothetical protein